MKIKIEIGWKLLIWLILALTAWFFLASPFCPAYGMDFFDALSMQESGDNDLAVGPQDEVSRYQILPSVWKQYSSEPICNATNQACALRVAQNIVINRLSDYVRCHSSCPQWEQLHSRGILLALIWKCPSRIDNPPKAKLEQAECVANLVSRKAK